MQIVDLQAFLLVLCALEGSRTPNLLIRSQVLYPIKLRMHFRCDWTAKVALQLLIPNFF